MRGDFSRSTFRPEKHYSGVRLQQGRLQTEADANEAQDIFAWRTHTQTLDSLGLAAGEQASAGFALAAAADGLPLDERAAAASREPLPPGDFFISKGRYYVDGQLCVNEATVSFFTQPDPPGARLPQDPGVYLVYLGVWQHHVTALDDPDILEVALGGPDTATRTRTLWQVRWVRLPDDADVGAERVIVDPATAPSTGRLHARAERRASEPNPCLIAPDAGYRGPENQLYRVEVHDGGALGEATFKWSRDNGSKAVAWLRRSGDELLVASLGNQRSLDVENGTLLELTDGTCELERRSGTLVTLKGIVGQTLTVTPKNDRDPMDIEAFPRHPKVRVWDGFGAVQRPASNDGYLLLENGVQVRFEEGTYSPGDYWTFAARTATGGIEWVGDAARPPDGVHHSYALLGRLTFDGSRFVAVKDLRRLFPAATDLQGLSYLGGDSQEASPGQPLVEPLRVGVSNGNWPVAGASVQFDIVEGGGALFGTDERGRVTTGSDGVAECRWTLGDGSAQRVEARLLNDAGQVVHLPLRFAAAFSGDARDAGVVIEQVSVAGAPLLNDSNLASYLFVQGIQIACNRPIATASVKRATCHVEIELPYPLDDTIVAFWGISGVLGYQTIKLAGTVDVLAGGKTIEWTPVAAVRTWLEGPMFDKLPAGQDFVLAHLRLEGNFIWQADDPNVVLDADSFALPGFNDSGDPRTRVRWPSGDGRRGGQLHMWFRLVKEKVDIGIEPTGAVLTPGTTQVFKTSVTGTTQPVSLSIDRTNESPLALLGKLEQYQGQPTVWVYTAPGTPRERPVTLVATCLADPAVAETATIQVVSPPEQISVSIEPSALALRPNTGTTFTVNVTGTTNRAVRVELVPSPRARDDAGTLGQLQLLSDNRWSYTSPSSRVDALIIATSQADPSKKATATVTVS